MFQLRPLRGLEAPGRIVTAAFACERPLVFIPTPIPPLPPVLLYWRPLGLMEGPSANALCHHLFNPRYGYTDNILGNCINIFNVRHQASELLFFTPVSSCYLTLSIILYKTTYSTKKDQGVGCPVSHLCSCGKNPAFDVTLCRASKLTITWFILGVSSREIAKWRG